MKQISPSDKMFCCGLQRGIRDTRDQKKAGQNDRPQVQFRRLEIQPQRELHHARSGIARDHPKAVRLLNVSHASSRQREIHVVKHVVSLGTEFNIEPFFDREMLV